jgi:hypothetical protein
VLLLRSRAVGVVIALVGLIFAATGVYLFVSAGWQPATATATSCHTSTTGSGTGIGTRNRSGRRTQQVCEVTWNDGGVVRTGSLTSGGKSMTVGQPFPVRVHGDEVALPSSLWVRVGTLALGVVLLGGGLVLALRRRPT